ncbi:unnamed protein product, partial [Clavelina lepadiformis]
ERANEASNSEKFAHKLRLELVQRIEAPQEDSRDFVYTLKAFHSRCHLKDDDILLRNEVLYL